MSKFKKKEKVSILDYPFGRPTKLIGTVMGVLPHGCYNVLMENGCNEGRLIKYKYWKLALISKSRHDNIIK